MLTQQQQAPGTQFLEEMSKACRERKWEKRLERRKMREKFWTKESRLEAHLPKKERELFSIEIRPQCIQRYTHRECACEMTAVFLTDRKKRVYMSFKSDFPFRAQGTLPFFETRPQLQQGMNAMKWLAHRETTLAQREKGAKEDLYKYYKCIDFPRSLSPSTTSYSQHQLWPVLTRWRSDTQCKKDWTWSFKINPNEH